ncbi:alpha/beta family hydrolase [Pontibacter sp. JAM-7]|uniref:alpha/beta family hydrolase n=1 Tax=Pontibacter sp. JAM-7 TaxID=3366581 RepID=UPI003AF554E6
MRVDGVPDKGRVLLAHGAGVGIDSPFMDAVAAGMVDIGLQVVRFEFPYMQRMREEGRRRPPDRLPVLIDAFRAVIDQYHQPGTPLFLAGKSMGGRIASMLLEDSPADAGFVFGYPFHAAGKQQLRINHLQTLAKQLHIFQGERDPMGSRQEAESYELPATVKLHWLTDGNHDLKPRKASGYSQEQHIACCMRWLGEYV